VVPVGTYREKHRPKLRVEALIVAGTSAQHAAAAAAQAAAAPAQAAASKAATQAYVARLRQRTLNMASYASWQRGMRVDRRDVAQVAVQERVMDLDSSSLRRGRREKTPATRESFVLGAEGNDNKDVGDDGYWWWQMTEANAVRWVAPQLEVLAADRGGWRAELKELEVGGSEACICWAMWALGSPGNKHAMCMRPASPQPSRRPDIFFLIGTRLQCRCALLLPAGGSACALRLPFDELGTGSGPRRGEGPGFSGCAMACSAYTCAAAASSAALMLS
jgi:hypothetical protein